jgi:hypothetical protein
MVDRSVVTFGDQRVAALDSAPLHRWLLAVRRLMQHHALPVTSRELTVGHEIAMRTIFEIDLEQLVSGTRTSFEE